MQNILLVYYSRTGTTKKVALEIQRALNCDLEEITSIKDRKGALGYLLSGKEGMKGEPAQIKSTQKNPADYDMVIVGTPVWSWNLSSPARAYLMENKGKFKKAAFFLTMGSQSGKTFQEMEKVCGQKPSAVLALQTIEVVQDKFLEKVSAFIHNIHTNL